MKLYIAAPWVHKEAAKVAQDTLVDAGFDVTSRWLDFHGGTDQTSVDPLVMAEEAENDIEDVFNADWLVLLNIEKSEGKAVEMGMALAWGIPVMIVGERSNIFTYLDRITLVATLEDALERLNQ